MSQDEGQLVALLPDGVQANINPERKQDKHGKDCNNSESFLHHSP